MHFRRRLENQDQIESTITNDGVNRKIEEGLKFDEMQPVDDRFEMPEEFKHPRESMFPEAADKISKDKNQKPEEQPATREESIRSRERLYTGFINFFKRASTRSRKSSKSQKRSNTLSSSAKTKTRKKEPGSEPQYLNRPSRLIALMTQSIVRQTTGNDITSGNERRHNLASKTKSLNDLTEDIEESSVNRTENKPPDDISSTRNKKDKRLPDQEDSGSESDSEFEINVS